MATEAADFRGEEGKEGQAAPLAVDFTRCEAWLAKVVPNTLAPTASLDVRRDDVAALRRYKAAGYREDGWRLVLRVDRNVIDRLPANAENARILELQPNDIPTLDREEYPDACWVGLFRHERLAGYCRIQPSHPSLGPFACTTVADARVLLGAAWRRLRNETPSILVVADGGLAFVDGLVDAGATVELDLVRLSRG